MEAAELQTTIVERIFSAVERMPEVVSATIAGSFSDGAELAAISDIDTIIVVKRLDAAGFAAMQWEFTRALEPLLAKEGFHLRINPTLGPLKFNDERTAVLHLMVYTCQTHRDHAIKSPFTCLDWQRSQLWRKSPLQQIYPVFGLQPHHFISSRRGASDYLRDLLANVITYRELQFDQGHCREAKCQKPMSVRDRHEFAYHVIRFLMQNFLKLVRRHNHSYDGEELLEPYFALFPVGADTFVPFYRELRRIKRETRFTGEVAGLIETTTDFVTAFESQFREAFEQQAVRHLVFRHAATTQNRENGFDTVFLGRSDPDLSDRSGALPALEHLAEAVERNPIQRAFSSPLKRAGSSLRLLAERSPNIPEPVIDNRLREIDYAACEGLTVRECREQFPDLFSAWARSEDPEFPGGGENTAAVGQRVQNFSETRWAYGCDPSITCTHNVVLRTLVGRLLSLPRADWHRIRIGHLAPITVVSTQRFGQFVDLTENVERAMFADFLTSSKTV